MSVKLLWDATTDTICWDLNSDYTTDEDFTGFGGIQNTAGTGKTGDIKLDYNWSYYWRFLRYSS